MIAYLANARGAVNIEEFVEAFGGRTDWQGLSGYFTIGNVTLIVNRDGSNRERLNVISDSDGILLANHVELLRFFRIIINPYIVSGDFEQLTDMDVAAGVRVAWFNWHTYRDVTEPVDRALAITVSEAESRSGLTYMRKFSYALTTPTNDIVGISPMGVNTVNDVIWFIGQVGNNRPWDIKWEDPWKETIVENVTYPGERTTVVYEGQLITLGDLLEIILMGS